MAVVEAGGFYEVEGGNTSVVPAYCIEYGATTVESADMFPLVDWGFLTTPQPGLNNRTLHYGRGKTLGGRYVRTSTAEGHSTLTKLHLASSAQNAMIYNRGTIDSFSVWADAVNDSSRTFEELLPYFANGCNLTTVNASEPYRAANASDIPLPANPAAYNTTGGPLHISYPKVLSGFLFLDPAQYAGSWLLRSAGLSSVATCWELNTLR